MILNSFIVLIGVLVINSPSFDYMPLRLKSYLLKACRDCHAIEEKQKAYKLDLKSANILGAKSTQVTLVEQDTNDANLNAATAMLFNEPHQMKQNKSQDTILIAQLIRKSLLSAFAILYSIIYFSAIVVLPLVAFIN
jgi:hypothetical protein